MTAIRLYLDEDVHTFIAAALRRRHWEAITTEEAERRGASDPDQLAFATNQGFTIFTYNAGDFADLHYETLARSGTHAGIIVGTQVDPGRNLRALISLMEGVPAESMRDTLVYLNNWV